MIRKLLYLTRESGLRVGGRPESCAELIGLECPPSVYTISICGSANSSLLEIGTSEVAQVQGGAAQLQGPHHLIIIRLYIVFLFIGVMEV